MSQRSVDNVAVIGAGTMGPGMAVVFASRGYNVRLMDVAVEVLERAEGACQSAFSLLVEHGVISPEAAEAGAKRIEYTLEESQAVERADFVVEAIPERLELKQDFFRRVESLVGDNTILASNTSGIPITKLGDACRHPERVVGMHWSNPPHVIPVIEVVRGEKTSDETVALTQEITRAIGMIPVVVRRDIPGFVENRILYAIMREALHLLDEGVASAEDIDTVVKWGIGFKLSVIGPLELLDVAGLDIYHSVASYLNAELASTGEVNALVQRKVEQGKLGIKSGEGLFEYQPGEVPALMKARLGRLLSAREALSPDDGRGG